jgi:hypothetical protein
VVVVVVVAVVVIFYESMQASGLLTLDASEHGEEDGARLQ